MKISISTLRKHWFAIIWLVLLAASVSLRWVFSPSLSSALAVAALVIGVPVAYAGCYRSGPKGRLLMRCLMLALFGLWLVELLFAASQLGWLSQLLWLQYAKWLMVLYLETQIAMTLWRLVRKEGKSVDEAHAAMLKEKNMPAWAVAVGQWELAFWKAVGRKFGALGRRIGKEK